MDSVFTLIKYFFGFLMVSDIQFLICFKWSSKKTLYNVKNVYISLKHSLFKISFPWKFTSEKTHVFGECMSTSSKLFKEL